MRYAQIDLSTGLCISVSYLSGEVDAPDMIQLGDDDNVNPGDIYDNGEWIPASPPNPTDPGETNAEKIARLEAENADLKSRIEDLELAFAEIIVGGA